MTSIEFSCTQCRARKLKCDRVKPSCGRCVKTDASCVYPSSRKPPPGRWKKIRELEAKLAQLENVAIGIKEQNSKSTDGANGIRTTQANLGEESRNDLARQEPSSSLEHEEILPEQQLMEELLNIYFDKLHTACPILHKSRYISSLHLQYPLCPPLCLQYIVLASAAGSSERHMQLAMIYYQRARMNAESDDMRGLGDDATTLPHVQCWNLIANFEAQHTMFSRASISFCRSLRLAQMLNLHRLDSDPTKLHTSPEGWSVIEEQRRTWWVIFCSDRLLSATTGWPLLISVKDISTFLPASDVSFQSCQEESTGSLESLLRHEYQGYSELTGRVLASCLFHEAMDQACREFPDDNPEDIQNGTFWTRHRRLDNDLTMIYIGLPPGLRLPQNFRDGDAAFINILILTATICLHRSALSKLQASKMPDHILHQSEDRLLPAAEELLQILRMSPDVETVMKNPIIAFAAFMAAMIFLEDFAANGSSQSEDNLVLLLKIMLAVCKTNAVPRSLALQLAERMREIGVGFAMEEKVTRLSQIFMSRPLIASRGRDSPIVSFCLP
ncbi:fungal-specific transcription factor domain-containing protein [Camillea tinctor]|nr:fungal-specific transcription factor domain-containing protein [Camillea tinctor]